MPVVAEGLKEMGIEPTRRTDLDEEGGGGGGDRGDRPDELDMLVDPGVFRQVDELVRTKTEGRGSLQVVELNVQQEGR